MELSEIIAARPRPGGGVAVTVTRRCPLSCAHCSFASTTDGTNGPDAADLLRFVRSFAGPHRPEVLLLTGGEPLLRPALVADLAAAARRAGTRSAVLSGAFFARDGHLPRRIRQAIAALDHFSVSIDAFHEREVPRDDVFLLLCRVLELGVPVSVHTLGADDYLADLTAAVHRSFGTRVPMLVNTLRPVGRAGAWAPGPAPAADAGIRPCSMAAWPVVAADGAVLACGNQDTVDRRPVPDHLLLGQLRTDDWARVRGRALDSPVLRLIRSAGPGWLSGGVGTGYCQGCRALGEQPGALQTAQRLGSGPAGALLDRQSAEIQIRRGPVAYLARHADPRYAYLLTPEVAAR